MVLMCAEPSSLMTKRYSEIMDTSIHLELIQRMMTFSPDMVVRSGGDASAATRIASSSLDRARADLRGTG